MIKLFFSGWIFRVASVLNGLFLFLFKRSQLGHFVGVENRAVQEVEDHTADLEVGSFVAVNLLDWDQTPVIGKVTAINDGHVTIHYWKGTYESSWKPDHFRRNRRNVAWTQDLRSYFAFKLQVNTG